MDSEKALPELKVCKRGPKAGRKFRRELVNAAFEFSRLSKLTESEIASASLKVIGECFIEFAMNPEKFVDSENPKKFTFPVDIHIVRK